MSVIDLIPISDVTDDCRVCLAWLRNFAEKIVLGYKRAATSRSLGNRGGARRSRPSSISFIK